MANIRAYRLVQTLQDRGHDVLLTGGLAVEGWSGQDFKTRDWDIVGGSEVDIEAVHGELRDLGYEKNGNVWVIREESNPPQNPGQFLKTQYLWGKTHTLKIVDYDIQLETVAPEWLFVDRCKKVREGIADYAEQGLFILRKFKNSDTYKCNSELVQQISSKRSIPENVMNEDFLESKIGH